MQKTYNPSDYEDALYARWEKSGFFNPDVCIEQGVTQASAQAFSIMLPPPNATGTLHIGHASMLAIEDVLIRYHRMKGDKTLWLPGTDHAALATHEKVERLLWEEERKTRHTIGREEFLRRVDAFVEKSRSRMTHQMRKMGASLDWSREAFTLDEKRRLAVNTAFKRMFDDGIIYRGDRIVNWDPLMQTTVSDDEIVWKKETTSFYYFQYGPFVIGTSRPETKFGDKYVVVHPDDERYAKYKDGETFEAEWVNGKITATLIKDEIVDMSFGSGAMTITPWHDTADFDIAEKRNLDKEQIIGYDGKMLPIAGEEFEGLSILEARKKIITRLKEKGLLIKVEENYIHNIATNERGGGTIEPQIKRQWFIDVNKEFEQGGQKTSLKKLMQRAVREGDTAILPERFEKIYFHWIDNLRDWCISRQIWYGHRVPIWYKGEKIFCGTEAPEGDEWEQDPDVLDTWFSSGLWTFSTLGWPEKTQDLDVYHPTAVLETGYDILFPWVSRMILMSTYLLGEVPFKTVYLHGLVRDEQGRKMSKSIGNVIDPLDIIPKYGTDAIRLSLLLGNTPGNDVKLGEEKIATYRNFTNKLWNIARFVLSNKTKIENREYKMENTKLDSTIWILSEMKNLIDEVTQDLDAYRFSQAGEKLRDFTWNIFADWYIEISKFEENKEETGAILTTVLEDLLKLWHPFMPFVTEAIWQEMGHGKEDTDMLLVAPWPDAQKYEISKNTTDGFSAIFEIIQTIRNLRAEHRISPNKKIPVLLSFSNEKSLTIENLKRNQHLIIALKTGVSEISFAKNFTSNTPHLSQATSVEGIVVHIPVKDALDTEKEKSRLEKEKQRLEALINTTQARLRNRAYQEKAPAHIVEQTETLLSEYQTKLTETNKHLNALL